MAESKTGIRASRLHPAFPVVTVVLLAACLFATPQPHLLRAHLEEIPA